MYDGINTSISEFQNEAFDKNIAKFVDHHDKAEDIHVTVQTQTDRVTHHVPNRSGNRIQYFQSTKSKTINSRTPTQSEEIIPEPEKNLAANYIDKGLVKLPSDISDMKELLIILDLSKNKFEYFPLEIAQFLTLKVLRLDHNKIKCIPGEIYKLTKLEVISIAYNALQTLPSSFTKMTALKEINLQNNLLEVFPEELTSVKTLTYLNILQNKLAWFPSSFKNLTNLNELHFEWFKYAKPSFSQFQKGKEGEENIKKLLWKCADLAEKNIKGLSFLEFIEYFSIKPVDLTAIDSHERTMLHVASTYEDVSVIRYLISYVPDLIDKVDNENNTALCSAILKDRYYAARYLLKHGANPTKGGGLHGSALHIATKKLSYTLVNDILALGENPNRIDNDGNTPLHHATVLMAEGHPKGAVVVQMLLEQGANPNPKNKENWTPLHLAARRRCAKTLNWIISYNSELEEVHGREEIFKLSKRGGAYKWTAMHIAAYAGVPDLVEALGEAGVDMFKRSVNGYTAKRVVNKYGISLKLLEKYEALWIKNKVFKKRDYSTDSIVDTNLLSLNRPKHINGASKNKFGENTFIVTDAEHEQHGVFGYFFKSKAYMFNPFSGNGLNKKLHNESQEVFPEMETEIDEESYEDEQDTARLDFCTEINEDVSVGVNNYTKATTLKEKKEKMNVIPGGRQVMHRQLKSKSAINLHQSLTIDVVHYEKQLKSEHNFDFNFCRAELKYLKDNFLSERLIFTDKLKILMAYKILHKVIIEHVYKHFIIPVPMESFPYYVLKESVAKGNHHKGQLQNGISQNAQAIVFYEFVPQHILTKYQNITNTSFENMQLKIQLIKFLTELLYFPAIEFFNTISSTNEEEFMVKTEAKRQSNYLQSLLDSENVKNHLRSAANQTIKKKLYGNMPNTKAKLNPVKRPEKNESIYGVLRSEEVS